jgi:tetratricopeptide (TPR) repeat protein
MKRLWEHSHWAAIFLPLLLLLAVNVFPRSWTAEYALALGQSRLQASHPALAENSIGRAAESLPSIPGLWERAGVAAFQAKMYSQAANDFVRAQSLGQLSIPGLTTLGDTYAAQKQFDLALQVWQPLLGHSGPTPDLYQRIQNAHAVLGEFQALKGDIEARLVIEPQNPSLLYQLGLLMAIYQPDQAAQYLNKAAALDPSLSSQSQTVVSGLVLALNQQDPAYRSLLIGRTLGSIDSWELAVVAMQTTVDINPRYAEAWAFLGEAQQHINQDGFPALQKAIDLNPQSVLVQALQSVYWRRQGKPDRALVYLHAAEALEPENPVWQVELGSTLAEMGDLDQAVKSYQAATSLAPKNPAYYRALAEFSAQYGFEVQEVGLPAARQAVLLRPEDAENDDVMGVILLRQGDVTSAERFLLQALEKNDNLASAHLHLAMVYLSQNHVDSALPHLHRAAALAPHTAIGDQAQNLINQNPQ